MSVTLQQYIRQLKKAQAAVPEILEKVQRGGVLRAIDAAQAATPPKEGTGRGPYIGTNTITGELKAHWAADTQTEPEPIPGGFRNYLQNNMQYASYVDQGHRMDRHFVPGLYINEGSGLLEFDPAMAASRTGGLVVGTKTKYVKGEFMVDKAKKAYQAYLRAALDRAIKELVK